MSLNSSPTQVFYHLLDLNDDEKTDFIKKLEHKNPKLYQELTPLLEVEESNILTDLFSIQLHDELTNNLDFCHQTIDKYHTTDELGRGGMGVVYAAHRANQTFDQELAIKFIQPTFNHILDNDVLFAEAQLLAQLNHPYIAKVIDGGIHKDSVYIVMEKINGVTLDSLLATTSLSKTKKLTLFICLCQAVEHAHQNQVLHADLKPENILIDEGLSPKLIDFNLTQKITKKNNNKINPLRAYSEEYASPEQKEGAFLGQTTDVFSLGKLLEFLLPQQDPHSDISWIINKAVKQKNTNRYPSVMELRRDIEAILQKKPISLKERQPFYRSTMLLKRRPIASFLTLISMLIALSFTATLIEKNKQLEQEKIIAENMMYEITRLMFHTKGQNTNKLTVSTMLELTRRRILSNPDLPPHIKQKMLLAMMVPKSEKK